MRRAREQLPENFGGGNPELWDAVLDDDWAGGSDLKYTVDRELARLVLTLPVRGSSVVELGCGASRFLPALASAGARVAGVDFVPRGVDLARRALAAVNADGSRVVVGRIEDYVQEHRHEFDAAFSFGLVEHFNDLDEIVERHFDVVRPGGTIFIAAPNLSGVNLWWTRIAAPGLYTWHRPISAKQVGEAMTRGGGRDVVAAHVGGFRLFSSEGTGGPTRRTLPLRVVRKLVNGGSEALYRAAPQLVRALSHRLWSPSFAVWCRSGPS